MYHNRIHRTSGDQIMPLTKRTTVLFTPELFDRLHQEAKRRGTSIGHLIRQACEDTYRSGPSPTRVAAVEELARLALPNDTPEQVEAESMPESEDLIP
jgi:hypothetical protein